MKPSHYNVLIIGGGVSGAALFYTLPRHQPRRFLYVGTLDPLRRFDVLLDAFASIADLPWQLEVSALNPAYLHLLLEQRPLLHGRIDIRKANDRTELGEQVGRCDIGLALLPPLPVFATTLPAKVTDYAARGLPVLLTDTPKNRDRFGDGEAFFCGC